MGGVVLHDVISSDGIQEVLCYPENLHVISEEPIIEIEEQVRVETPPTTNTSDLTGFTVSSEPLVELDEDVLSEPAKKFFYDNAASLLLNTVSVVAVKLYCVKGTAKIAYSAFADVFDYAMKSLGNDYFKRIISEKIGEDIDKLFITNKWAAFSKREIASVVFKVLREAFLDGSTSTATKIAINIKQRAGMDVEDVSETVNERCDSTPKWPGCIYEIMSKVLIKDSVQEVIGVPYIDPITAPYMDLKVSSIIAESSKSIAIGFMFKGDRSDVIGLVASSIKISIAKYTTQWLYEKYLEERVKSCIDSFDEYTGLKKSHPGWGEFAKVHAGSAFCKLPTHIVRFMLA